MKNVVFVAHWSLAFIEEQFYAFYKQLKDTNVNLNVVYFCQWNNGAAVRYLVEQLFETKENLKPLYTNFPPFTELEQNHSLISCIKENTVFVMQFNPVHLKFFLRATGNRFPINYIWWQIEQPSNNEFFNDILYLRTIANARFVIDFLPTENGLQRAFSRDKELLLYDDVEQDRIKNIANHQSLRLVQDNPRFSRLTQPHYAHNQVLLLGTCDVLRRRFFRKICNEKGINVLHPHSYNYLFAKKRQDFIQGFVNSCHDDGKLAIAVNVHQYENSELEKAKLYLLLANNCDIVISEHSISKEDDLAEAQICNNRLFFVNNLQEMITKILQVFEQEYEKKDYEPLKDNEKMAKNSKILAEKIILLITKKSKHEQQF